MGDGETKDPPVPENANPDTGTRSHGSTLTGSAASVNPHSSSSFTSPSIIPPANSASAAPGTPYSTSLNAKPRRHAPAGRNMANIKFVKHKKRARSEEQDAYEQHEEAPVRSRPLRSGKVPTSSAGSVAAPYFNPRPAASPSLPSNAPWLPPTAIGAFAGNGMKELVHAMDEDQERFVAIKSHFDRMYAASPDAWYAGLRERWSPEQCTATVSCPPIRFWLDSNMLDDVRVALAVAAPDHYR